MIEAVGADWTLSQQKRTLDLLGITALMPAFIPAGIVIASEINTRDNWDPIFEQERIGREFEPFTIYKFRTMPPETPDTPSLQGSADARRSNFGASLSSYHLDEMPQTRNVYNGTMSMVGPRALLACEVESNYDTSVLSYDEQKDFTDAMMLVKPGVFGLAQLSQHMTGYTGGERERALATITYSKTASFKTDMKIIFQTAKASLDSLREILGDDVNNFHLRGESGAQMLEAVANGYDANITEDEHMYWQSILLAARLLDNAVDESGIKDVRLHVEELCNGLPLPGMRLEEAAAFQAVYLKLPHNRQQEVKKIYTALPMFAMMKKRASTSNDVIGLNNQEAWMFAALLELTPTSDARRKFNTWLERFAISGYSADLALDAKNDYEFGRLSYRLSDAERAKLGSKALLMSSAVLLSSPIKSYPGLLKGAYKTLTNKAI